MSNEKVVKLADRQDPKTIKLKNSYFEGILGTDPVTKQIGFSRVFQTLLEKNVFPNEFKPRYWLERVFDKIMSEVQNYQKAKQKLIQQHTKKYESDGKETDKDGKVVKEWKKGDYVSLENGSPDFINPAKFIAEFQELLEIEIDPGIQKIAYDPEKGPDAFGAEMRLLLPLIQEPEN